MKRRLVAAAPSRFLRRPGGSVQKPPAADPEGCDYRQLLEINFDSNSDGYQGENPDTHQQEG